jgi:hypothetical protein
MWPPLSSLDGHMPSLIKIEIVALPPLNYHGAATRLPVSSVDGDCMIISLSPSLLFLVIINQSLLRVKGGRLLTAR